MNNILSDMTTNAQKKQKKESKMRKFFRTIKENANKLELIWDALRKMNIIEMTFNGDYQLSLSADKLFQRVELLENRVKHLLDVGYVSDFFQECPGNIDMPGLGTFEGRHPIKGMVEFQHVAPKIMSFSRVIRLEQVETVYTTKQGATEHALAIARFKREVTAFNKKK